VFKPFIALFHGHHFGVHWIVV